MNGRWKRMLFGFMVLPAVLVAVLGATPDEQQLSVMTRNVYIGGNQMDLATATDVAAFMVAARTFLTEVALSNFPERAQGIARQIDERRPDIVALQEVYNLKLNFQNSAPPFVDYLQAILDAVADLGLDYVVVASVQNTDVTVPIDLDEDGVFEYASLTDRDVILARVDLVAAGAIAPVSFGAACSRPSADGGPGCNYSTYAEANLPFGTLILERGFVAVDVTLNGRTYRVVNTHLEVDDLDPTNPLSPLIQSVQATELKAVLEATSGGLELLVVGDFNSHPDNPLFPDPATGPFVRPYQQLTQGVNVVGQSTGTTPYVDTWLLRPGAPNGYTCCNADLRSPVMNPWMRIDLVFSRSMPADVKANVFDNNPEDKTASGLWPSDHAGLFVRLWF